MTKVVEYSDFSDLTDKVNELYETYNRVEYLREAGPNEAEYFCAM